MSKDIKGMPQNSIALPDYIIGIFILVYKFYNSRKMNK